MVVLYKLGFPIVSALPQALISPFLILLISKDCEKRPISLNQIEKMAGDIEKDIQNNFGQEIASSKIGELVMDKLKEVDEIAYVRFASVYRQFKDIESFKKLIDEL